MATEQQLANRKRLIEALRAEMPAHFKWDFGEIYRVRSCGAVGCAVGLSRVLGIITSKSIDDLVGAIGIPFMNGIELFAPGSCDGDIVTGYGVPWEQVTPQMVADKLEAL